MKTTTILGSSMVLALSSALTSAGPMGTAFTYQGRLNDGPNPANGSYDFKFTLCDTNDDGNIVAGPIVPQRGPQRALKRALKVFA